MVRCYNVIVASNLHVIRIITFHFLYKFGYWIVKLKIKNEKNTEQKEWTHTHPWDFITFLYAELFFFSYRLRLSKQKLALAKSSFAANENTRVID